jgi:hypothetical protein
MKTFSREKMFVGKVMLGVLEFYNFCKKSKLIVQKELVWCK